MKAVKISMNEAKTSKQLKAVIAGTLINALITLGATIVLTLFMSIAGNLFEDFAKYLMLLPLVLGGYIGGFISARINGANGLLLGVISGAAILIILLIIGFTVYNTDITYMILLKVLCVLLPAAIGGVKGVNKKEKFKI